MRNDQIGPLADGLCRRGGSNGQARHHALDLLGWVTNEQTDVVPFSRQRRRGECIEKCANVGDNDHYYFLALPGLGSAGTGSLTFGPRLKWSWLKASCMNSPVRRL